MMEKEWKDIRFWYDNMILQQTEEEVVQDLCYDKKTGEKRDISYKAIRKEVDKRILGKKEN